MTTRLVPWFIRSGVVRAEERPRFAAIVRDVVRLRGGTLPWELIVAAVLAWTFFGRTIEDMHELAFAGSATGGQAQLGFGGRWFLWVLRPIYVVLLLAWGWRLVLLALFFARVAKLDLDIVPTHPDRAGGLGFVERFALIQSPAVFALSAVFAAHWGHQVLYHNESLDALQ